ncbi:MAG: Riboflavin biosynthesis protein RibF [Candidatus Omnitrophica bacterium ADurb.Bin314]|jgi:riboflavin kinase/FMN adenylyltransferase|nr:MAG: Riboflavin biosynthesis protein RibF [Candidatus Omnitrophica bacterium ADurb.Bin314]HOE69096.1 riboflavin biosynthesis protein RibF [Candidatus Omnitrophota bacterium]
MRTVTDLHKFKAGRGRRLVLALGNFDGFHLGHQKLIRYVTTQARRHGALAAALTFRNHPQIVLHPEKEQRLLFSVGQKLFYLKQAGIDLCFAPAFTKAFSKMPPEVFVEKVLVRKLRVFEVCMGYDARFGYRRCGTTDLMRDLAGKHGFLFRKMEPVMIGGRPVSSSGLRELVSEGKVEKVSHCLGRPFSLFGKVVRGKGRGARLGAPTANVEVHANIQLPVGVYVASARVIPETRWFPGVLNYGNRPTYPAFETPNPVLEMHMFDFKRKVYGKEMEIAFHHFIRPERQFGSEEALKVRIQRDIETAKRWHLGHVLGKKPFTNCGGQGILPQPQR